MGGKKKYIEMFSSFTEPFNSHQQKFVNWNRWLRLYRNDYTQHSSCNS